MAGAVSVAKAVYMPSAFQCFAFLKKRNVILNLFQHLIPLFLFLGLAYAELKVNFVEGFAVKWLKPFLWLAPFLWLKPFICLRRFNASRF